MELIGIPKPSPLAVRTIHATHSGDRRSLQRIVRRGGQQRFQGYALSLSCHHFPFWDNRQSPESSVRRHPAPLAGICIFIDRIITDRIWKSKGIASAFRLPSPDHNQTRSAVERAIAGPILLAFSGELSGHDVVGSFCLDILRDEAMLPIQLCAHLGRDFRKSVRSQVVIAGF